MIVFDNIVEIILYTQDQVWILCTSKEQTD